MATMAGTVTLLALHDTWQQTGRLGADAVARATASSFPASPSRASGRA